MKKNIRNRRTTLPVALRNSLESLMETQKDEMIPLNKFHKAVTKVIPGIQIGTSINFLRHAPGGWFVEGRRGHPSRFVFGQAFEDYRKSELRRREWRRENNMPDNVIPHLRGGKFRVVEEDEDTNMGKSRRGRPAKARRGRPAKVNGKGIKGTAFLTIKRGGKTQRVPVKLAA